MSDNGRSPGRMYDTLLPIPDAEYLSFYPFGIKSSCVRQAVAGSGRQWQAVASSGRQWQAPCQRMHPWQALSTQ
jgi:hypothetical protein